MGGAIILSAWASRLTGTYEEVVGLSDGLEYSSGVVKTWA